MEGGGDHGILPGSPLGSGDGGQGILLMDPAGNYNSGLYLCVLHVQYLSREYVIMVTCTCMFNVLEKKTKFGNNKSTINKSVTCTVHI